MRRRRWNSIGGNTGVVKQWMCSPKSLSVSLNVLHVGRTNTQDKPIVDTGQPLSITNSYIWTQSCLSQPLVYPNHLSIMITCLLQSTVHRYYLSIVTTCLSGPSVHRMRYTVRCTQTCWDIPQRCPVDSYPVWPSPVLSKQHPGGHVQYTCYVHMAWPQVILSLW